MPSIKRIACFQNMTNFTCCWWLLKQIKKIKNKSNSKKKQYYLKSKKAASCFSIYGEKTCHLLDHMCCLIVPICKFGFQFFSLNEILYLFSMCLGSNEKLKLVHYLVYFCYYSWIPLHFYTFWHYSWVILYYFN